MVFAWDAVHVHLPYLISLNAKRNIKYTVVALTIVLMVFRILSLSSDMYYLINPSEGCWICLQQIIHVSIEMLAECSHVSPKPDAVDMKDSGGRKWWCNRIKNSIFIRLKWLWIHFSVLLINRNRRIKLHLNSLSSTVYVSNALTDRIKFIMDPYNYNSFRTNRIVMPNEFPRRNERILIWFHTKRLHKNNPKII